MIEPRFTPARSGKHAREEWSETLMRKAETELERGCIDCGKAWELHFRKGSWKGCGA